MKWWQARNKTNFFQHHLLKSSWVMTLWFTPPQGRMGHFVKRAQQHPLLSVNPAGLQSVWIHVHFFFLFLCLRRQKICQKINLFSNCEANVRQLMYLVTCGLFKELHNHLTGLWAWDLHTPFLKENTNERRKIRDVPYFLPFFDVSLWDGMNNSTVFIPHRITDVFLPSLLLSSLQSQTSLGFHLSLPQHLFIWLTVYSSLLAQSACSCCSSCETAAGAEERACHYVYVGIGVNAEAVSNRESKTQEANLIFLWSAVEMKNTLSHGRQFGVMQYAVNVKKNIFSALKPDFHSITRPKGGNNKTHHFLIKSLLWTVRVTVGICYCW